jgi:hypothetical protein
LTSIEAGFLLTGVYPPPIVYINGEARYVSRFSRDEICREVARLLQPQ